MLRYIAPIGISQATRMIAVRTAPSGCGRKSRQAMTAASAQKS